MFFKVNGSSQKRHLYAYEDLSFLDFERSICPQCNRTIATMKFKNAEHHLLLEGGSAYPDLLQFCGAGERLFLISEKAKNVFEDCNLSGYSGIKAVKIEVTEKRISMDKMPNYYSVEIIGKVDFDFGAMCLKKKRRCSLCDQFDWNRQRLYPMRLDYSTWDGSDLCFVNSIPGIKVCTEELVKIVKKYSLTGFDFKMIN